MGEANQVHGGKTLRDAMKVAIKFLLFLCGEHVDKIFTTYINAIVGMGFFDLAVMAPTSRSL
jgi:hypothetical protein